MNTCSFADDVAAYLLDALSDDESAHFGEHLMTCESCAEALATLQPVVNALPGAAPQVPAPAAVKRRVMAAVRAEAELLSAAGADADRVAAPERGLSRWFPRPAIAAGLAAGAVACGAGGAVILSGDDETSPGGRTLAARVDADQAPGASAALHVSESGNTLNVTNMPSPPEDRVYQVWLKQPGRAPDPTDALFTVNRHGAGTVAVPGNLSRVEQVLVTAEPRGGSQVPTRTPMLVATVASA